MQPKTTKHTETMGIDQHGNTYHALGKHPRKALLARLGRKRASIMYRDDPVTKQAVRIGYVIGGCWIRLYRVEPIESAA